MEEEEDEEEETSLPSSPSSVSCTITTNEDRSSSVCFWKSSISLLTARRYSIATCEVTFLGDGDDDDDDEDNIALDDDDDDDDDDDHMFWENKNI